MRLPVLAALLLLAACGPDDSAAGPTVYPEAGAVPDGIGLTCPGAYQEFHWTDVSTPMCSCWWSCARYGGTVYRTVGLLYEYAGYWRIRTETLEGPDGC